MIINWIYSSPVWVVGIVIVGGTMLLACLGLLLFHRLVDYKVRREHNEITGATIGIVGTVTALLLAFVGVAAWQTYNDAQAVADREAAAIGSLYFDSSGLSEDVAKKSIQTHIKNYLDLVIDREWMRQRQGMMDQKAAIAGRSELVKISLDLMSLNPQSLGQANIQGEMLRSLNELLTSRRSRIAAANDHMPTVLWIILLLGTAATIGYTYFFGTRSLAMHLAITGSVAASMALVILLIVVMDYPFRGEVSVDADDYETVRNAISNQ